MPRMTPYDRIIARLNEVHPGWSPRKASMEATNGKNADLIRGIKRDRSKLPRGENLKGLARVLDVSLEWLILLEDDDDVSLSSEDVAASLGDARHIDSQDVAATMDLDPTHFRQDNRPFKSAVPQIAGYMGAGSTGEVITLSAGEMQTIEPVAAWWLIPPPMLRVMDVPVEDIAAWPMGGDSMEPTILRTDVVFINTRRQILAADGIWAVDYGEGRTLKRVDRYTKRNVKWLKLISDNPRYPPKDFPEDAVHIFGRYLSRFTLY